jgi:hypothetical protein
MRGDTRFSRLSGLLEKMISTLQILAPTPHLQRSRHGRPGNRMSQMGQHGRERMVIASVQSLQQHNPFLENSCRQAFAKA